MTVADCAGRATTTLVQAGFAPDAARRDVAVIMRHVLGWDTAAWLTRQREEAPAELAATVVPLVARRATGEPVAYLIGTKEFYGRPFVVSRDVLIPRPETERLVERALAALDARAAGAPVTLVDVGTGSGCVAVTLAVERPGTRIVATDTSAPALVTAATNARRHAVEDQITFRQGRLTAGTRGVDLVVSNPPYVPMADRAQLMRDVRDFEPASALFGGDDGLDVIRSLAPDAFVSLRPGGTLLVEVGAGQADAVREVLAHAGFTVIGTHPDLAGIPRVVEGQRPLAADGSV